MKRQLYCLLKCVLDCADALLCGAGAALKKVSFLGVGVTGALALPAAGDFDEPGEDDDEAGVLFSCACTFGVDDDEQTGEDLAGKRASGIAFLSNIRS